MFVIIFILLAFISCLFSLEKSCFFAALYKLDRSLDTSSTPLDLSRFCSRHLLDIILICRDVQIYIYSRVIRFHSISNTDTSLFSLDPNLSFSQKSFFPSRFRPIPSFNSLVCALNLLFLSFLMLLDLGFFESFGKFGVLEFLQKILGWVLLL